MAAEFVTRAMDPAPDTSKHVCPVCDAECRCSGPDTETCYHCPLEFEPVFSEHVKYLLAFAAVVGAMVFALTWYDAAAKADRALRTKLFGDVQAEVESYRQRLLIAVQ
jgi:hypothetical protein